MKNENTILQARFCGPPKTGNGGFTAGMLVEAADVGAAEVRLLKPVPVESALVIESENGNRGTMYDAARTALATLTRIEQFPDYKLPEVPDLFKVKEIAAGYPGFTTHPFPTCFVCGPKRHQADGMRIFVGPAPEQPGFENLMMGHWLPDETVGRADGFVRDAATWGALDCPGGFAAVMDQPRLIVLSKISARVLQRPRVGEDCTVVSWRLQKMSRAFKVMTSVFNSQTKQPLAIAESLWLAPRNWDSSNMQW